LRLQVAVSIELAFTIFKYLLWSRNLRVRGCYTPRPSTNMTKYQSVHKWQSRGIQEVVVGVVEKFQGLLFVVS